MKKKVISTVLAVLMLTALFTTAVSAENEGDFGTGLHWACDETTHTLTISLAAAAETGSMPDYSEESPAPWSSLAGEIQVLEIKQGVTNVGANAFAGITLTSAAVPCTLASAVTATTVISTHQLTHHDAVYAELTKDGTKEYWDCPVCHKLFSDAAGTAEITSIPVDPKTDQTAPKVEMAYLTPSTVILPSTTAGASLVTVTVQVDDGDQSGCVTGSATLTNTAKSGSPSLSCTLSPDSIDSDTMTGTVLFTDNMLSGQYYISEVTLTDAAGNTATYTNAQLPAQYQSQNVYVYRNSKIQTLGTLTLNATSVGYGGVVTGTITLKDYNGNAIVGKSIDIYVGGTKTSIVAVTDSTGTATFDYSNSVPGTYSIEAKFTEDVDYTASTITPVTLTVTSVPATGDHYDIGLWICVAVMAIGANVWFFRRRKTV